ncbi:MAG TPA: hypothetical protein VFH48_27835 [Chloroflexota bacterium]|nr:hypothetical protein [Chloroflexota bacterium]
MTCAAGSRLPDVHRILPIGLHLGEAISRIHTGGSVGALFGVPVS